MSGYWDAANWSGRDRERYQRELDEHVVMVRQQVAEREEERYAQWVNVHVNHRGEILSGSGYGAGWCSGCGEVFDG